MTTFKVIKVSCMGNLRQTKELKHGGDIEGKDVQNGGLHILKTIAMMIQYTANV